MSAASFTLGPLVQVSGASPFSSTCDDAAGQTGDVFLNSEVEPWIDVNPSDPLNMIGVWQQDRWSNGGSRGLVAGVTVNGGTSWTIVNGLKTSLCTGGTSSNGGGYQRATDPWVTFGPPTIANPMGIAYQLSLSFNDLAAPITTFDFDHALLASRSTDKGLTWSDPVAVIRDTAPTVFNDKQSITADPTNANYVYAVWDRLVFPGSERASVVAAFRTSSFSGPAWFARSSNAGLTWEPARPIHDPGQRDQTIGNQIVVQPSGALVDIFTEFNNENAKKHRGGFVRVLRSTDKGSTWSGPFDVGRLGTIEVRDPDTGHPVRTGDIIPDIAVDSTAATGGRLYAVWQDASFNGGQADAIAFSQSLDGGLTWSTPIKVNKTPTNVAIGNQQAFTASVDVSANGTISVTYYDFRSNTSAPELLTEYFVVHCHPTSPTTCTNPASWEDERALTAAPFDMSDAPDARGFFTGDYEGLASAGNAFTPFFSQPHGSDPSSTFFRRAG
ncbi:MAG: exo-alpha-sialidase [Actinobacteria bacterium]|nr:exo-alpha-sialidase [Actinomycetota bacterium]